jgi:hypothetical protein
MIWKTNISFGDDFSAPFVIQVYNSLGHEIMRTFIGTIPGVIDLSGNVTGVYYIRVEKDSAFKTAKILLK